MTYDARQARRVRHAELRRERAQVACDVHGRAERDDVLRDDACADERERAGGKGERRFRCHVLPAEFTHCGVIPPVVASTSH